VLNRWIVSVRVVYCRLNIGFGSNYTPEDTTLIGPKLILNSEGKVIFIVAPVAKGLKF
jgi:hypothetical protein